MSGACFWAWGIDDETEFWCMAGSVKEAVEAACIDRAHGAAPRKNNGSIWVDDDPQPLAWEDEFFAEDWLESVKERHAGLSEYCEIGPGGDPMAMAGLTAAVRAAMKAWREEQPARMTAYSYRPSRSVELPPQGEGE